MHHRFQNQQEIFHKPLLAAKKLNNLNFSQNLWLEDAFFGASTRDGVLFVGHDVSVRLLAGFTNWFWLVGLNGNASTPMPAKKHLFGDNEIADEFVGG